MDVCKPNCKLCLRVWVPPVRKELLAVFSSIVFKSQPKCALGASWGGAGAKVSLLGGGRCGRRRRSSGSLPLLGGGEPPNHRHRRSFALQRRRIPAAPGAWDGKEPSGNLEMSRGASESCSFVELVPHRPSTENEQRSLASDIRTFSANRLPFCSAVLF